MDRIIQLCTLLEKKIDLFSEYEKDTLELIKCEPEDMEHYTIHREALANEIDDLQEEIGRLCDADPNAKLLYDTTNAKLPYSQVPPEWHPVFERAQNMLSVISRIQQSDKQIIERMEKIREDAQDKIKQNQHMPKIKKYLTDLSTKPEEGTFRSGKA